MSQGFHLAEAASCQELLTLLADQEYDLLLSDLGPPGLERWQVLEIGQAQQPPLPVVIWASQGSEEAAVDAMKRGAADYLPATPQNLARLPLVIRQALAKAGPSPAGLSAGQARYLRLYQAEHQQRLLAETLGRVALALNVTLELPRLLEIICQESARLFAVNSVFVWLVEGEYLVGFAGYGPGREDFVGLSFPLSDPASLGPRVVREQHPIFVNNVAQSDAVSQELVQLFQIQSLLGAPLLKGGQAIGVLMLLDNQQTDRFGPEDVRLALLLGSHAAIAIDNARLYDEIRQRAEEARRRGAELEALRQASLHLTANLELKPLLEAILEQTLALVVASNAHVFLYDGQMLTFGAGRWSDGRTDTRYTQPRTGGLTYTVARTGQQLVIPDVNAHPLYQNWQWNGAIIGLPLRIGDQVIGVMNVAFETPHAFQENELQVLRLLADQAAIAVQNAQLFEATRRQLKELTLVHAVAVAGVEATHEDELIERITRLIGETFYPDNFGVLLVDEANGVLWVHSSYRLEAPVPTFTIPLGQGITGRVAVTGMPQRVANTNQESAYLPVDESTVSELCVPIKTGDRVLGVINAESRKAGAFSPADERLLSTLAGQLAAVLERLRAEAAERQHRLRLAILTELAREMTGTLNIRELALIVTHRVCSAFGYYNVSFFLADEAARELVLEATAGAYAWLDDNQPDKYRQAYGRGIVGQTAERGQMIIANDAQSYPGFFELEGMFIRSELAIPLKLEERLVGVLNIDSERLNAFDRGDVALLQAVANQLVTALEKARLFEETSRRAEEMRAARDILHALNAVPNAINAFPTVAAGLRAITACDRASIALLEENGEWFTIVALDQPRQELSQGIRMPLSATACASDVMAGRVHLTP
ncbi:MAG: GAF domain-containing protein, partial [Chloroflexi bacterium]|nr:GAF domain-containing protein [Chloroflexota bacterium]